MQRGVLGARALNSDFQNALNPNMAEKIERFGCSFAPSDNELQRAQVHRRGSGWGTFEANEERASR